MAKSKQKLNPPKSVSLEKAMPKVANKPLIMSSYKPLPRFKSGCMYC